MKHIVILLACAMLSACKDKPKVQTWKMAPESEWMPSAYSNYVYPMKSVAEVWPVITNENPLAAFTEYRRFTYTVNVADGLWTHTNVIEIKKCSDFCTRLRYVDGDVTNDFHAAFASFTVKTNSP